MTVTILFTCAALLAGVALSWLFREREVALLRQQLVSERESFERERSGVEVTMRGQFAGLAQRALDGVSRTFLELANAKLGQEQHVLKGVLAPVQEEFAKFTAAVGTLQKNSAEDLGALKNSLEQVVRLQANLRDVVRTTNDATGQLRNALQNPRIAGNWGEIGLDRIVELAGMTQHCDFDRQIEVRTAEGSEERPDLTIRITGGLKIPVDAKTSATNYIRAVGEADENERKRLLKQSTLDLKSRVTELRGRGYDRIDGYAGMTFLFVPNESMLSSALAQEPGMIEDGLRYGIVICSPLLLLCYLRAFANGWRMQKQQENAEEVARRGRMLHERLLKFFTAIGDVGKSPGRTVEKYNDVVGKMDNLLVPGRELGKLLGLAPEPAPLDGVDTVREVRFKGDAVAVLVEPSFFKRSRIALMSYMLGNFKKLAQCAIDRGVVGKCLANVRVELNKSASGYKARTVLAAHCLRSAKGRFLDVAGIDLLAHVDCRRLFRDLQALRRFNYDSRSLRGGSRGGPR